MPACFFALQRFFLRVDNVLFRINETRLFHIFGSDHVLREYSSRQISYHHVLEVKLSFPEFLIAGKISKNAILVFEKKELLRVAVQFGRRGFVTNDGSRVCIVSSWTCCGG